MCLFCLYMQFALKERIKLGNMFLTIVNRQSGFMRKCRVLEHMIA